MPFEPEERSWNEWIIRGRQGYRHRRSASRTPDLAAKAGQHGLARCRIAQAD